jgi:hypothetical protein
MIDPTPNEQSALVHAGCMGGEYLTSLGKTDLVALTDDEWMTFLGCVIDGFCDHLRRLAATDQARLSQTSERIPF